MSVANIIDESVIEGAQKVGVLWKIYIDDPEARAMFLSTGLSIRHRLVNLYDENPFRMKRRYEGNLINSYPGCKILDDVKYSKAKNPAGGWTNFKNGTVFVT